MDINHLLQLQCPASWLVGAAVAGGALSWLPVAFFRLKGNPALRAAIAHLVELLQGGNMPSHLKAVGLIWTQEDFEDIWEPAFIELEKRYYELCPKPSESSLLVANLIFTARVMRLAYQTAVVINLKGKTNARFAQIAGKDAVSRARRPMLKGGSSPHARKGADQQKEVIAPHKKLS